ncbi:MAG: hypothetical protein IJA32_11495, partial [Lachnospiraceae bacterium]|nr:hypothetical protein [Lachnospiraceae bacterium]
LQTVVDSQITVTYCYLMCEGQTTGSYLRLVYEDSYFCGECQAYLYKSDEGWTVRLDKSVVW